MMSDEEAADLALSFGELQSKVILLCARRTSIGYSRMAETIGVSYERVQKIGRWLQAKKLAHISVVRSANEYSGSALFLNDRGEQVRHAVELLAQLRAKK